MGDFLDKELPPGFLGIDPDRKESRPEIFEIAAKMWPKFGEKNWVGVYLPRNRRSGRYDLEGDGAAAGAGYRGSPGMDLSIAQGELILTSAQKSKEEVRCSITKAGEMGHRHERPNAGTDTQCSVEGGGRG